MWHRPEDNPTREELIWWHNPNLLLKRSWYQEYLKRGKDWLQGEETPEDRERREEHYRDDTKLSVVTEVIEPDNTVRSPVNGLPVLLFLEGVWQLTYVGNLDAAGLFHFRRAWRTSLNYYITNARKGIEVDDTINGPDDPTLSTMEKVLCVFNDPRTVDLESIAEVDDTIRAVRLIQAVYQHFVVDEKPSIASLWKEDGQVLCGWNDLYEDDGRRVRLHCMRYEISPTHWSGMYFGNIREWRHLVPK